MRKKRLAELYQIGELVELFLQEEWHPGIVIRHAHPALWVQLTGHGEWFVTNRQRIRKLEENHHED